MCFEDKSLGGIVVIWSFLNLSKTMTWCKGKDTSC